MPKSIQTPNPTPSLSNEMDWLVLRQGLKRCIEAVVSSNARVYERWPLKFELGQTAELLKSKDGTNIHSWIIGINRAMPYIDRVGGSLILWDLTVRIWGFMGYEYGIDSDNPQNTMETECRKLTQVIYLNREHLSLDNTQCLKEVGLLEFPDIDAQGFGHDDIIVAQGELRIKLKEVLG